MKVLTRVNFSLGAPVKVNSIKKINICNPRL